MVGAPAANGASTLREMPTSAAPTDAPAVDAALRRAVEALRALQNEDGHFRAELEGDSILQSEYLLMKFILGQERAGMADGRDGGEILAKVTRMLRSQQRGDGTWGQYPGSAMDISATVKGYFSLKLMGDDPEAPHMAAARTAIVDAGGAETVNSFTKFYLACLGQVRWSAVPAIPPEIMFLPRWFPFHLSNLSAWTRTMVVPLSLVATLRPTRLLPAEVGIDELYVSDRARHRLCATVDAPPLWRAFFGCTDRLLKIAGAIGGSPLRQRAIRAAEQWIVDRSGQDDPAPTEGLGAIFPPMVYQQIAFQALGYERDHPVIRRAERELDDFFIEDAETIRIQPCFSPVWDTGIATYALADAGFDATNETVRRAADWLRDRECRFAGDWVDNLDAPHPGGGWWFEYRNAWYPDVDDTAMVAMALRRAGGAENEASAARGVDWIRAMQNDDGGWAAFDRTRDRPILEYVPFADHNAMQDPSCPDITGRVLECLAWHGATVADVNVDRAIAYIRSRQEADGSFFGRWGVNYLYGTWQAVIGPIRCGVDRNEPWIQRAGEWVRSVQQPCGAFGESADSYIDPTLKGQGPPTASQTAWGAMVLGEVFGWDDPDAHRAIDWLVSTQLDEERAADPVANPDGDAPGAWVETEFTGTGFPRVFYLRYHLYRLYFPIMAIARFLSARGAGVR